MTHPRGLSAIVQRRKRPRHLRISQATVPFPPRTARQHRLKVCIVGEAESGRTSLCKSLANAADRKTRHPLVVSGQAAALKMDSDVFSVQTFDVPLHSNKNSGDSGARHNDGADDDDGERSGRREALVEVTAVDSGPAPLSDGAGSAAMMEADVVLLCFPLYGIKQVVARPGGASAFSLFSSAKPTEAFIHPRDFQLLTTLLTLLSTRCVVAESNRSGSSIGAIGAAPLIILVGTFHDALKDASVAATHTILRALHRLCERVRQRSPSILPVADVCAVSTVQSTSVSLTHEKQVSLSDWWRLLLQRATHSDARERTSAAVSLPALRHLLAHPNRLSTLNAGVRQIFRDRSSPRLLDLHASAEASKRCSLHDDVGSAALHAEDNRVTSLVIDFVTQLKTRKRVWLLPLPKLWRVAYALGMQTREQLYLVLRQMEATGEVSLLGRGLSYTEESRYGAGGATNETVCLCPALLRTSFSILYVYADWVAHRQRRHVRKCLRGVDLEDCAVRDPHGLAGKGTFSLPLLRGLGVALGLKNTSSAEAAELLAATLVGSDMAYVVHGSRGERGGDAAAALSSPRRRGAEDPLQPPSPTSASARRGSARANSSTTETPPRSARLPRSNSPAAASTENLADPISPASSAAEDFPATTPSLSHGDHHDDEHAVGFSPNITVAELTSLFLLGELTASTAAPSAAAAATLAPSSSGNAFMDNASFDPVRRVIMQHTSFAGTSAMNLSRAFPEEDVSLVVPSLQPSSPCPDTLVQHVVASSQLPSLPSSLVAMRLDPSPYDLIALLTCRFASVALHVERTHANAALFSFNTAQLLCPTTDHVPLYRPKATLATPPKKDGCCFLFCAPQSEETASCAATLQLAFFADSPVRVAQLEYALCMELRRFLLQRLPGVSLALERATTNVGAGMGCGSRTTVENFVSALCSLE